MVVLAVFAKRTLLFLSDGATLNGEERTEVPECRTLHVSSSQRRLGSAWFCTSCLARILPTNRTQLHNRQCIAYSFISFDRNRESETPFDIVEELKKPYNVGIKPE